MYIILQCSKIVIVQEDAFFCDQQLLKHWIWCLLIQEDSLVYRARILIYDTRFDYCWALGWWLMLVPFIDCALQLQFLFVLENLMSNFLNNINIDRFKSFTSICFLRLFKLLIIMVPIKLFIFVRISCSGYWLLNSIFITYCNINFFLISTKLVHKLLLFWIKFQQT